MNPINQIIKKSQMENIMWMMDNSLLQKSPNCMSCNEALNMKETKRNKDGLGWRCYNKLCLKYGQWVSIRVGSFFANFSLDLQEILKAIYFWSTSSLQSDILKHVDINKNVLTKLKSLLIAEIRNYYSRNPIILGGPGKIVQIDETMLNHKIKAHRGRGPKHQCWALCIVDCSFKPSKGFATIIKDKSKDTILPIINEVVRTGSIIHTDEAKVYNCLKSNNNYIHKSVVHKYKFVDYDENVHTQNVESYNNKLKLRIKAMKGIKSHCRENFLYEFLWLDENAELCFQKTLDLIKFCY